MKEYVPKFAKKSQKSKGGSTESIESIGKQIKNHKKTRTVSQEVVKDSGGNNTDKKAPSLFKSFKNNIENNAEVITFLTKSQQSSTLNTNRMNK